MKKILLALALSFGLLSSAFADYAVTPSNAYQFESNGKKFALALFTDEFGSYLVIAKQEGSVWLAQTPYIDNDVTEAKIAAVGGAYNYILSKLTLASAIFSVSQLPVCPVNQSSKINNLAYDLGAGDVKYNAATKAFEMTKVSPLSHVACPVPDKKSAVKK